jgi:hypothetical protein
MWYVGKFCRKGGDEVMGGAVDKAPTYTINKAHVLLGHNNDNDTRQIASHVGWTITRRSLEICDSCANAKARQKYVPNISTSEKATMINGRWFQEKSTLKVHKGQKGTTKTWNFKLMSSLDSHGLGFITRRINSLRVYANAFKHSKPEVTLY